MLERSSNGRKQAASIYAIHYDVLSKIGDLSTNRGTELTARKADPAGTFHDLAGAEKLWLEAAVRRIIQRMGEHASGAPLVQITMADFPAR